MTANTSIIAMVDCNNFYASCERVFNPRYTDKPVVVLSNNDGCVVARSNEAKAIGIDMGTPIFKCRELVEHHGGVILSSNYALYGDLSRRVMETLSPFTPEMEIYSIDEAFLILSQMSIRNYTEYGQIIRKTVKQWTGIPVSVGIASTKTLAKIANRFAKRTPAFNGVFVLENESMTDAYLHKIDVQDIWGIGSQHGKFLHQHGISNGYALKDSRDEWIRKHLSVVGLRMVWELRGIPCIEMEEAPPPKKGIVSSRSFGRPVESLAELKEALAEYVSRGAEKLRRQDCVVSYLHVFLMTNRFKPEELQYSNWYGIPLETPTCHTGELIRRAHHCLEQIYLPGYRYKKVGMMFTGISPASCIPLTLFPASELECSLDDRRPLMGTIDQINRAWGRNTIQSAAAGIQKTWRMRQASISPRYTTRWEELPRVRIINPFHPVEKAG